MAAPKDEPAGRSTARGTWAHFFGGPKPAPRVEALPELTRGPLVVLSSDSEGEAAGKPPHEKRRRVESPTPAGGTGVAPVAERWQVELEDGHWKDFKDALQELLVETRKRGDTTVKFDSRGMPYEVDFRTLLQCNLSTGKTRKIREAIPRRGGGTWQVELKEGEWLDFDSVLQVELQKRYLRGDMELRFERSKVLYEVDFTRMTQKNMATMKERMIRSSPKAFDMHAARMGAVTPHVSASGGGGGLGAVPSGVTASSSYKAVDTIPKKPKEHSTPSPEPKPLAISAPSAASSRHESPPRKVPKTTTPSPEPKPLGISTPSAASSRHESPPRKVPKPTTTSSSPSLQPAGTGTRSEAPSERWQVQLEHGTWHDLEGNAQTALCDAMAKGNATVQFKCHGRFYEADLKTLLQRNLATSKVRNLRLLRTAAPASVALIDAVTAPVAPAVASREPPAPPAPPVDPEPDVSWDTLRHRLKLLPYKFPTERNRMHFFADRRAEVEQHAKGVRPILLSKVVELMEAFLKHKRAHGSKVERRIYDGMGWRGLLDRCLKKRPLVFMGTTDLYMLRDSTRGSGGFDHVGKDTEHPPFVLADFLSYEEMQLSALCGVSVPTHFINEGGRVNKGVPAEKGSFEDSGIYVGVVGARYERPNRMEWQYTLITPEQNTVENGFGMAADATRVATQRARMWSRMLYGAEAPPTYADALAAVSGGSNEFLDIGAGKILHVKAYQARMRLSIEPFLRDANDRAKATGKRAYVHAIGLGLGAWMMTELQAPLIIEVFAHVLSFLDLEAVADVDFSWFPKACTTCGGSANGELLKTGHHSVRIHFSSRDPAAKLTGEHAGKLLVAMYAWDGNAYPGNEYWMGALAASGDPAAACCSMIPELQNPDVNPFVSARFAKVW